MSEENRFNPREHLMQLKSREGSKDYLPVAWRLVWFRELCPEGTIETEVVLLDLDKMTQEEVFVWNNEKRRSEKVIKEAPGVAIFKATVKDGKGGIATGTKMEKASAFGDFMEKAETGSIGRALAALGYGTQFTGDEFNESHRIVDAPVERSADEPTPQQQQTPRPLSAPANTSKSRQNEASEPVAEQQEKKALSLEDRVKDVYKRALALRQFTFKADATDKEKTQAFLDFVGPLVNARLTSVKQITGTRIDEIEAYLKAKDAA